MSQTILISKKIVCLKHLPGTDGQIYYANYFETVTEFERLFHTNKYTVSYGTNGSIQVYEQLDGRFRCRAFHLLEIIDDQKFTKKVELYGWVKHWLIKIK